VIGGLTDALDDARRRYGITGGLILCFLRHLSEDDALATWRAAAPSAHDSRSGSAVVRRDTAGRARCPLASPSASTAWSAARTSARQSRKCSTPTEFQSSRSQPSMT